NLWRLRVSTTSARICLPRSNSANNYGFGSDSNFALPLGHVNVTCVSANESFVNFYAAAGTADLSAFLSLQGKADAVHHKPRSFLSDTQSARDFVRADSVPAVHQHPDSSEPLLQGDWRILKNSSDLRTELAMIVNRFALPLALVFQEHNIIAATGGANHDAIRPAFTNHVGQRIVGVCEELDRLRESAWLLAVFHAANLRPES